MIRLNDLRQSQQHADYDNSEHERYDSRNEQFSDICGGAGDCGDVLVAVEVVLYEIVGRDAEKLA